MIIGQAVYHDGNTCRTVALVRDRLVINILLTGRLLDGTLNGIIRHIGRFTFGNNIPQLAVAVGIRASLFDGNDQFTPQLGKYFTAGSVILFLLVFNVGKL